MHEHFMRLALAQASQALSEDEVPVGAVIVRDHRVIAAAYNQRERLRDPTAHAEMVAITQAAESVGDWRLEHCTLYVTLEPCPMCAVPFSKHGSHKSCTARQTTKQGRSTRYSICSATRG